MNKNTLCFLDQLEKNNMFSNLLLTINEQGDLGDQGATYFNQNNKNVKRIGQKRLKSLEVIHSIL